MHVFAVFLFPYLPGEPHVFTYDVKNFTELGRILSKIKQLPSPSPHVPFEFTYFGFLEVSKQRL